MLLLAVLLMPLAMIPAAAAPAHHEIASMQMGHCPDQAPRHDMKGGIAECTMACAGALPAADLAAHDPPAVISERLIRMSAHRLQGLHPESEPPPPKPS
jgi:hypothetical protein